MKNGSFTAKTGCRIFGIKTGASRRKREGWHLCSTLLKSSTGKMLFLTTNQQSQITDGTDSDKNVCECNDNKPHLQHQPTSQQLKQHKTHRHSKTKPNN